MFTDLITYLLSMNLWSSLASFYQYDKYGFSDAVQMLTGEEQFVLKIHIATNFS